MSEDRGNWADDALEMLEADDTEGFYRLLTGKCEKYVEQVTALFTEAPRDEWALLQAITRMTAATIEGLLEEPERGLAQSICEGCRIYAVDMTELRRQTGLEADDD